MNIAAELRDELLNGEIFYGVKEAQTSSSNGASTTTRSDRTRRSTIGHLRHRHSRSWLTT
jgi:hypothetical protein